MQNSHKNQFCLATIVELTLCICLTLCIVHPTTAQQPQLSQEAKLQAVDKEPVVSQ